MMDDSDVFAVNPYDMMSEEQMVAMFGHMELDELLLCVGTYLLTATKGEQGVSVNETMAELSNLCSHELAAKCFKWTNQLVTKAQLEKRKN